MRVKIPFSYVTDVITSGGNEATRFYKEEFEVDVPEVSSADAPVALRWRGEKTVRMGYQTNAPLVPADIRTHADGLYEAQRTSTYLLDDAISATYTAKDLLDCLGEVAMNQYAGPQALTTFFSSEAITKAREAKWKGPPKAGTTSRRSHREENRACALKTAQEEAAGLLIVDGLVYFKVREPVLIVDDNRSGNIWITSSPEHEQRRALFRLDQADEALARAAVSSDKPRSEITLPNYEVLDPSCLRTDIAAAAETALVICAKDLMQTMGKLLPTLPIPAIEAFYDLREEIQRSYKTVDTSRLHGISVTACAVMRDLAEDGASVVHVHRYDLERLSEALGVEMDIEDAAALDSLSI